MTTAQTAHAPHAPYADTLASLTTRPERCAVVLDQALPAGLAANAAAILAVTLGARLPGLIGAPVPDGDGVVHPGLYPAGLPVLRASADELGALLDRALAGARQGALEDGRVGVIALPAVAQTTTDYDAFRAAVARTPTAALAPAGVLVCGTATVVRRLTGSFGLLR